MLKPCCATGASPFGFNSKGVLRPGEPYHLKRAGSKFVKAPIVLMRDTLPSAAVGSIYPRRRDRPLWSA